MSFLRTVLEQATRNWIFRRRLSSHFGRVPIYVSPSAGLRYLCRPMSTIDMNLLSLVNEYVQPRDVVWDVGANVGLFSFAAAQKSGRGGLVVACEPDPWLIHLLWRSASIQPTMSAPVRIVPTGVAHDLALRSFCLATRSRSTNHLAEYGTTQTGGVREEQVICTVTLDWLLGFYPPPAVLKVDVEGAELEVLKGAAHMLESARPIILCEVGSNTQSEVAAFLRSRMYKLYDGDIPARKRQPLDQACWSTLAIPDL